MLEFQKGLFEFPQITSSFHGLVTASRMLFCVLVTGLRLYWSSLYSCNSPPAASAASTAALHAALAFTHLLASYPLNRFLPSLSVKLRKSLLPLNKGLA